jgi:hypothetical protein
MWRCMVIVMAIIRAIAMPKVTAITILMKLGARVEIQAQKRGR